MGHVVVNISVKGERGEQALTEVLVDTGATYTVLSPEVVKQVGAWKIAPYTLEVGLGDGRKVTAFVYAASIAIDGREGPAIILAFEGAKEVVGVQALESLGLKVDPATGKLEATRPEGLAYFYTFLSSRAAPLCHCEERSDEAIPETLCPALLAKGFSKGGIHE